MDQREALEQGLASIVENAANEDVDLVKQYIGMFLSTASELTGILSSRYETLRREYRPNHPKPPKLAPAKPQKQSSSPETDHVTPKHQKDAQDRSQGVSRIQQGIQKARPSAKQALNRSAYGRRTDKKGKLSKLAVVTPQKEAPAPKS